MLLNDVMSAREVPLQDFVGHIDDLLELISRGLLRLKVSMYAWGVEYLVSLPSTASPSTARKHSLK